MRVLRLLLESGPSWAIMAEQGVRPIAVSPFGGPPQLAGDVVPVTAARLLPPVAPSKIFAVGRNYADHAAEMGLPVGDEPAIFLKPPSTLLQPGSPVVLPDPSISVEVEHEAELAVVVGAVLKRAGTEEASHAIFGFTCANDVSARDLQRTDAHITRAKGFDTFCPLGPWIETDLPPIPNLQVQCRVNGELRQAANTSEMLYDVPSLLAHISQWATLLPGDVVLTGTPAGTGRLRDGDHVEIEIDRLGLLSHGVARRV